MILYDQSIKKTLNVRSKTDRKPAFSTAQDQKLKNNEKNNRKAKNIRNRKYSLESVNAVWWVIDMK